MVHPVVKVVDEDAAGDLARRSTPSAQLPQGLLARPLPQGLAQADLRELLPPGLAPAGLPSLKDALHYLCITRRRAPGVAQLEDHTHPAWQRLKFELLAQQLSQRQAKLERPEKLRRHLSKRLMAARWTGCWPLCPSRSLRRSSAWVEEIARRPGAATAHARCCGAMWAQARPWWRLSALVAIDAGWQCALMAPHRDPGRAALSQTGGLAGTAGHPRRVADRQRSGQARQAMLDATEAARRSWWWHARGDQDKVALRALGLAVIDEQHRFGVARLALRAKLKAPALEPHQ